MNKTTNVKNVLDLADKPNMPVHTIKFYKSELDEVRDNIDKSDYKNKKRLKVLAFAFLFYFKQKNITESKMQINVEITKVFDLAKININSNQNDLINKLIECDLLVVDIKVNQKSGKTIDIYDLKYIKSRGVIAFKFEDNGINDPFKEYKKFEEDRNKMLAKAAKKNMPKKLVKQTTPQKAQPKEKDPIRCARCNNWFLPQKKNQKYHEECSKGGTKRKKAEF